MKKVIVAVFCAVFSFQASAGWLTGYMMGRASKSCDTPNMSHRQSCRDEYQRGYQDGLKACKTKRTEDGHR